MDIVWNCTMYSTAIMVWVMQQHCGIFWGVAKILKMAAQQSARVVKSTCTVAGWLQKFTCIATQSSPNGPAASNYCKDNNLLLTNNTNIPQDPFGLDCFCILLLLKYVTCYYMFIVQKILTRLPLNYFVILASYSTQHLWPLKWKPCKLQRIAISFYSQPVTIKRQPPTLKLIDFSGKLYMYVYTLHYI